MKNGVNLILFSNRQFCYLLGEDCLTIISELMAFSTVCESKIIFSLLYANCWITTWTTDWSPEASTESAMEAQVKAIHLCDWKGWSLAPPLLDPIYGLTATEEGSFSGGCSLGSFLWVYNCGEHFHLFMIIFSNVTILLSLTSLYTYWLFSTLQHLYSYWPYKECTKHDKWFFLNFIFYDSIHYISF